jgi:beta-lactamase class A
MHADLSALLDPEEEVRWSVSLRDGTGTEVAAHHARRVLSTASIGKLLLLVEVARQCETGSLDEDEPLGRPVHGAVADSGIWQHLQVERLSVEDLATLVGSVSDNLATNALLARVGLERVRTVAAALGMRHTRLLDSVRRHRGVAHPPRLSEGCATELSLLMADLGGGTLLSPEVGRRLDRWLSPGMDLSMVAAPLHLDPLAHVDEDRGLLLRNKTGTDSGVRADVGVVRGPTGSVSYAVIANWDPRTGDRRDEVLERMHAIGSAVLRAVG